MKRYQAVAFLLSTAMTVSSVAPVFGASNDVFGHWAELTITKWQNEGRIGGYEDGTFKPDKAITRAEFVRLLNSAAPTAFTSSASINFSDVKESDWFYADVAKAVGGRVASGFEDGTFRPGETVTRMQAAVFICNAKGLTPNEAAANNFTDAAQIPAWAKGAVGAAVAAGYLSGYPDGSFGGSKGMTRAEAVSTLDRVLGGGSTTTTPSGEIDTSDRDKDAEKEDNRTAEAGNMVWTSGGSGGGSGKKSSSSSNSSSSDKKTNNVTIRSQKDADGYEGKTLTGTTEIYVDGSGIDLQDIKFKGDVEIYAEDTVAAAYIGKDTAVAAASSTVDIYFEGKTNVTGKITVIRNNVAGADKVVIRTRTPRALSASVLAKVATKIVGFEINRVEATAPVEIAEGAKVNTVEAGDNATVEVAADASVDKVDVTGDAKDIVLKGEGSTDVTVKDGASANNVVVDGTKATVELNGDAKVDKVSVTGDGGAAAVKVNDNAKVDNVAVSDSASADVAVADKAAVNKVELSDTATAKVDVAPDAKVDTITSTSTGKTEVSGEGTVDKIEATDPSTVDTSNAGDNVANVDKKEDTTPTTPATTTIKGADLAKLAIETPTQEGAVIIAGTPDGVKASGNWTIEAGTPSAPEVPSTTAAGDETTYKATITLEAAEAGKVVFDTAIKAEDLTGIKGMEVSNVKPTAEKVTFDVTATVTEGGEDPTPDVTPKSIALTPNIQEDSITLKRGNTVTIKAEVTGSDNKPMTAPVKDFKWIIKKGDAELNTEDKEKIIISENGQEVTITNKSATSTDGITVSAEITGKELEEKVTPISVAMSEEAATLKGVEVEATGQPSGKNGNYRPSDKVTFTLKGIDDSDKPMTLTPAAEDKITWEVTGDLAAQYSTLESTTADKTKAELIIKAEGLDAGETIAKTIIVKGTYEPNGGTALTTTEGITIKAEPAAVASKVVITSPEKNAKVSVKQGSKSTEDFIAEVQDQYGDAVPNKTATWEIKAAENKDVVAGTAIGSDNKLTVAKTEPKGTLTVIAECGDLTTDTREVTVTEAGSTPEEGTTVAATATGEVTGTTTNNTITIDLPSSGYKFVADSSDEWKAATNDVVKDWFTATGADLSELTFTIARTSDTRATVTVTAKNTLSKAVKADTVTIDGSKLKSLIVKDDTDSTALGDKDTVDVTTTEVKFNIPDPNDTGDTDTPINSAKLAALTCVKGEQPATTLSPAEDSGTTANYDVTIEWKSRKDANGQYDDAVYDTDGNFAGGNQYKAVITLAAKDKFKFAPATTGGKVKVTVGNEELEATLSNSDKTATVEKEFTALEATSISTISYKGDITAPKTTDENLADLTSITKPEGTDIHYTVEATGWTSSSTKAVDAGTYTATLTFTADEGYKFDKSLSLTEITDVTGHNTGVYSENDTVITFTLTAEVTSE